MSVLASTWAWQQEISPNLKLVLVALADHAHDDGSCAWPSVAHLAKKTGYSERQVKRILGDMVDFGLIRIAVPATRYRPNEYALQMSRGVNLSPLMSVRGDISDTSGVTSETPRGDTHVTLTIKEPSVEPSISSSSIDDAWFADFWKIYPRKVGKGTAHKAFLKALARADALDICEGAVRLLKDPNRPPIEFVPHPTTWLNRDGWLDAPYPERERTRAESEAEVYGGFMDRMQARASGN